MDTTVLYNLTYGLYVVGAFKDGRPVGCVINTCFQVTSDNPLLAISLNKANYTLEAIREFKRFSLSIIAEDSDPSVIGAFGFRSSREVDKYEAYGYEVLAGTPCVKGKFAGRLVLEAEQFVDCETHVIVIGRLIDTQQGAGTPMTYAYYHNVIKGKAPKNAPTYRDESTTTSESEGSSAAVPGNADICDAVSVKKRRYECDICGYIAEVDGELPDDYICPLCLADRSHFFEIE